MKDITRVHIASISYDIELDAKKKLQAYIQKIRDYADDDIAGDVETRMVELFGERGVKKDGVVTADDVDAVIGQLGQPEAFSDDGDIVTGPSAAASRKLFRDSGGAWIGGIAAGLARYYDTRAWWIRLLFALSIPLTSGFSILIYVLLWLVIPATKTPSDVLRLEGSPVTVSKMSLAAETATVRPNRDRRIARAVSIVAGVGILASLAAAAFGAAFAWFVVLGRGKTITDALPSAIHASPVFGWFVGLGIVTAVLMAAFALLLAYLLISWRFTRAVLITLGVIMLLGLLGGIATVGAAYVGHQQAISQVERNRETRTVAVPDLRTATSLTITNLSDAEVTYIVTDTGAPHIQIDAPKGTKNPSVALDGTAAHLTVPAALTGTSYGYYPTTVTVYGPAVGTVTVDHGAASLQAAGKTLDALTVSLADNASLTLTDARIATLTAALGQQSHLSALGSGIGAVKVSAGQLSGAEFATIASLDLTAPDTCASRDNGQTMVSAEAITSGSFTLNGKSLGAQDYQTACLGVTVGRAADTVN